MPVTPRLFRTFASWFKSNNGHRATPRRATARREQCNHRRTFSLEQFEPRQLLASDIALTEFSSTGTHLLVSYDITEETAPAFNVSVYRSADGVTRDALIGSREVTLDQELAVGRHTIDFGADFDDVRDDYKLIAVVDSSNNVAESSEENNEIAFQGGAFLTSDGTLHVHGSDAAESVKIDRSGPPTASGITVKINEWMMEYDAATIHEIHLRLHGGDDVLKVQPQLQHNIQVHGGAGNDRILTGAGSDWLVGGTGDDFIAGRGNRDYIEGNDGDDTLLGGADNDTLLGLRGNDKVASGSGRDIVDGGDGADIVDGGQDDDMVYSGRGADRMVNLPGANEARDAKAEDTLLETTPEELISAELSAAQQEPMLQTGYVEDVSLATASPDDGSQMSAASTESYGFNGSAGPFWLEPSFGSTTYHPEEVESSFWPFDIRREDTYGPAANFDLSYSGAATAADFLYRQTNVTVPSGVSGTGVEIQVYHDATLESTEDFTAWFASAVVPSEPGMYIEIGYPSYGQPSTDPDGEPFFATGYIVDGELNLYNGIGLGISETHEQTPGAFMAVGELHPLEVSVLHSAGDSFRLNYPPQFAAWLDGNRSQAFASGSTMTADYTLLYFEAIEPASNAVVELEYNSVWYLPTVDQITISAGPVDLDTDVDDTIEVNAPGQIISLNSNDDDGNSQSDLEQTGQVFNEGDLEWLPLSIPGTVPGNLSDWKAMLEVPSGQGVVKLWGSYDKSVTLPTNGAGQVEWSLTSQAPQLWVEGVSAGSALVVLTVWNPTIGAAEQDAVRLTVAAIDIDADTNNDGEIDPVNDVATGTDDPIESTAPGAYVGLNSDDDDGNGIADRNQSWTLGEDNLVPIELTAPDISGDLTGFYTELTATDQFGGQPVAIRVWDSPEKTSQLIVGATSGPTWTLATQSPLTTVWVEGMNAGTAILSYRLGKGSNWQILNDEVRLTVVPNSAPYFQPTSYSASVGRDGKIDDAVVETFAYDPQGDPLEYSIIGGNYDGLFTVDLAGIIRLTGDALLAASSYLLTIMATDTSGASATATVAVTVKDTVGVTGDVHAVEGTTDHINIIFHRFTNAPNPPALQVQYTVTWESANPADITSALGGTITIPAGQSSASIPVAAVADGALENLERFRVTIIDTTTYDVVTKGSELEKEKNETGAKAYSALNFYILDGVTLFAKDNADDVNGRDPYPNHPNPDPNPGIHISDANQGGIGDCYFMAALAALAQDNWQHVQTLVKQNPDGSFSAKLYDRDDENDNGLTGWEWFTFSGNILTNGFNMARLSGDFDGPHPYGTNSGAVEIWPQLLERAWAELKGGYGEIVGGSASDDAWLALTGSEGVQENVISWTDAQIRDRIVAELVAGNQVSIATAKADKEEDALLTLPNGDKVLGNHAYVVQAAIDSSGDGVADAFRLYNPWGFNYPRIELPVSYLSDVADALDILNIN